MKRSAIRLKNGDIKFRRFETLSFEKPGILLLNTNLIFGWVDLRVSAHFSHALPWRPMKVDYGMPSSGIPQMRGNTALAPQASVTDLHAWDTTQARTAATEDSSYARVFGPLMLGKDNLIAEGADRHVYQHPFVPNLLVKIVNAKTRERTLEKHPVRRWFKQFQRARDHRVFIAEASEYTVAMSDQEGRPMPLARVVGLASTSLGPGLLVEKITDGKGGLAPTLADRAKTEGLNDTLRKRIRDFFQVMADLHIVAGDISPTNIVDGYDAHHVKGLYLIDGFGVRQVLPIATWSRQRNARDLMKERDILIGKLERMAREPALPVQG